jgi:hypothetical protein
MWGMGMVLAVLATGVFNVLRLEDEAEEDGDEYGSGKLAGRL